VIVAEDFIRTEVLMDTPVTIQAPAHGADRVASAFEWFHRVEECCSRFDSQSELRQLTLRIGEAVPVSPMLFQAVQFALKVAEESGGSFDPTVGRTMEQRGFNREHRTGAIVDAEFGTGGDVSYRDVGIDAAAQTITLRRPLVLDLGAVAKGLAIDLAAHELRPLTNFAIDAGGDLYLGGRRSDGKRWTIGVRNPRRSDAAAPSGEDEIVEVLSVSDMAVCTSGDYERRSEEGHHILDPRTGAAAADLASVTVVAATAMLADAVATAAFVLGPADGLRLCERLGVEALMLSPTCRRYATRGISSGQFRSDTPILPDTQGPDDPGAGPAHGAGRTRRRP
jgi:FAD:protein FMN transferase